MLAMLGTGGPPLKPVWGIFLMTSLFRKAAFAVTALSAVAATPAFAAATASPAATATVVIVRALTLTANQNLDLGTVTINNTITGSQTVSLTNLGVLTCGAAGLTCTGTPKVAKFTVTGASGQTVVVTTASGNLTSGANTLLFSPNSVSNVALAAVAGVGTGTFDLGGAVSVSGATKDGTYSGNISVSVDYL